MFFREVANLFNEIENSSSRLVMTKHLAELFKKTPFKDAKRVVYLLQGRISPQFEGSEIGFGEKLITQGIAKASGFEREEVDKVFNKIGDLGNTAEEFVKKKKQLSLQTQDLTVEKVFTNLKKMSQSEGEGSQELKIKTLTELFNYATPLEARYIARIPLGNIRLGVGDPTIMDAFATILTEEEQEKIMLKKSSAVTKKEEKEIDDEARRIKVNVREQIEAIYNIDSDLGEIAQILKEKGLEGLKEIKIKPGTPIRPTAAERLPSAKEIIEKLGKCAVEAKYDGFRLQISKDKDNVKIFSRQSEEMTNMFPEIISAVKEYLIPEKCIVEGEALAYNEDTQEYYPFQVTIQRKRKYEVEKKAKEYPLNLFLFDVMYVNGESYLDKPLTKRREKLSSIVKEGGLIKLSEQRIIDNPKDLEDFFEDAISRGLEGIIAKDLNAPYIAGARKFAWIKLKRSYKGTLSDTLDLVIIGYYLGKGKRTEFGLGALLVATYNEKEDTFESVAKIGTGLTENTLTQLQEMLFKDKIEKKHARVISEIKPDYWVEPKFVVETRADEITLSPMHACGKEEGKGYALRFPRMIKLRSDKKAEEATTTIEVKQMFKIQKRVQMEEEIN
ncbi:MAG: ATP-dependent DNA ligase [Candidatus ainarchaeum sp.]|jgi:DNA ligase-1|nr:ATP-dependent DNA ligase [Candidatus ainarchaeum sp.]MDD3085934.1 ATP-dependent DNA ligase [Candidatus ainarchaeum sp.]MDD4128529.1 ATP-dependent DNA ligase [Candidatus ainarchaeum sp.]MDD4467658.1 ATP-dependent DNA ligase [Candidatus ainarchaeum sp.]HPM85742.1 ATP-dependent DNA ligase [archaeon]